jgi:hypothetical protein
MNSAYYLVLDGEFGGIGTKFSFLTAHFIFVRYDGVSYTILDRLDLKMKPNDNVYVVTAEAMAINKIDLVSHDAIAITYKSAGTELYNFLMRCLTKVDVLSADRIIAVGHNVAGDIAQILDKLVSLQSWEKFVSYHAIDTICIAQWLRSIGKIPSDQRIGLAALRDGLGIDCIGDDHTAQYDAELNLELLKHFNKMI